MKKAECIFRKLRQHLHSSQFAARSRMKPQDFVRNRVLSFSILMLFIINQLRKSIAIELFSFSNKINREAVSRVSRSAITQARSKLNPHAFIELNDVLVKEFYADNQLMTFKNLIVLAIDGTMLELPVNCDEIARKYGVATNHTECQIPMARASALYDVKNGIILSAILAPYRANERTMAIQHIQKLISTLPREILDRVVILFDRGYPSVPLIVFLMKQNINFVMRCNTRFISEIKPAMASGKADTLVQFSLKRTGPAKKILEELFPDLNRKEKAFLRVLSVPLQKGSTETLITSMLDKERYPWSMFKPLYFMRWGVEEGYKCLKSTLEIENVSGKSCIAIEQDFHATILAANACALLTWETQQELDRENYNLRTYTYRVNRNVSQALMKDDFIAILWNPSLSIANFCSRIKRQMLQHRIPVRPGRKFNRTRKHPRRNFHMNLR